MKKIVLEIEDDRLDMLGVSGAAALAAAYQRFLRSGLFDMQSDLAAGTVRILKVSVRTIVDKGVSALVDSSAMIS